MEFDLNESLHEEDAGSDSWHSNGECNEEPYESIIMELESKLSLGSTLESFDTTYVLYCEYARYISFSVRKGMQKYFARMGEIKMKRYYCACEGQPDMRRSYNRLAKYTKQIRRSDCKASLRVSRESVAEPWTVYAMNKEHNHELYVADQSYLLRSARNLSHAQKFVLEQLHAAGIGVSRACRFMERECSGVHNVRFIRKDAYDHMNRIRAKTRMGNADAGAVMDFFHENTRSEPLFYWNVDLDDDGRLLNFFYRDLRSAVDYELFGDVLSVDTTFKTNKYNLISAPFVGINHHRQNIMFGMGFLSDETARSFIWLFKNFLNSMHGKEPQIVFSDQCQALMKDIDECFTTTKHRLCQWHINQNSPAHFGDLNNN